jgi:hypothetical protein
MKRFDHRAGIVMSFVESLEFSRLYEVEAPVEVPTRAWPCRWWTTIIVNRYGRAPEQLPVDTNYATGEDFAALTEHASPPATRDDVTPHLLCCQAQKQPGAGNSRVSRKWSLMDIQPAGRGVRKLIERNQRQPPQPWIASPPSACAVGFRKTKWQTRSCSR